MNQLENLLNKITDKTYTIGIVGLGYVGLPLMWTFHQVGMPVIGYDIDEKKVENLKNGIPYIKHLGTEMMETLANSDKADATTDFSRLDEADAILLCVPTPLDHHREPDMSYVEQTTETVSKYLRKGQLVILESTTWPGTTEELMMPILEKNSGLKAGKDFYVAYSPEREDPGNPNFNTAKIPKVVGGLGEEALNLALAMYDTAIVQTVPVSDCKTAEAVKLTENIFRSVNIALVNELKVVYEAMDIDVHEVLDAADTKPFGFMKFTPGPGLGGHCIPIDPFYLTWKAREFEKHTRFIELAGEVNTNMPTYVVDRTMHALNTHKKAMNGSMILVIGLAYKPDVDDMRESPTFKIFDLLKKMGAEISYYDPFIPEVMPTREHGEYTGMQTVDWNKETVSGFDAVLISTNHSTIDYAELAVWSDCIIDTRNAMAGIEAKDGNHIFKA
ncbi:MAG: UDP-N-acetyl-D-glucosamine dehydrogenase [Balneola sp.]|jgi:UDP-N-acetyl-D-glucosamine dehydrogenase|nr:UDP-N-acetyl-D-glucosamine dehydrogenase [Balneola sp.]MBE80546.1 UDP-N-acetyl-D-glucosamine dehydrogenase [Balneola sp.]|tara:strand:+ start:4517 stop:5851 length:1335 start_codon:yes stop_codon:yes gene_type:complete